MTGADLIVSVLRRHGIDWMATLCGHGLDPLFHAARKSDMRLIDTRNEQTASYIADAYGRLTRRPGVCAVSSGIAHVNALAGVANAWFDSGPMVLISGAASTATEGKGHFQEMHQVAIAAPLCKVARHVREPDQIAAALTEALAAAASLPCGPVHLTFPMDVQNSEAPDRGADAKTASVDDDAEALVAALHNSERPVVVAGSGIFYTQTGPSLLAFCERHRIPVVTPIWDRGVVDAPSAVFAGVVGAASGGPSVLAEADCIVMAGAVSDYRVAYLQQVVSVDRWPEIDATRDWSPWLTECIARRDEFRTHVEVRGKEQAREGLHSIHIIHAIQRVLSDDPVLLIDGGSIGQWAHQLLCSDRYPGDWLTCGRSGVVGWGIGGAMAARLAFPNRPVILLSGDGAFTFNAADIESAVRQNLHFVAIVADDQGWGITRTGHVRQFGSPIASSLGHIAFDRVAAALGARSVRAESPDAIERELRQAIHEDAVTVIHVPIVGGNPS